MLFHKDNKMTEGFCNTLKHGLCLPVAPCGASADGCWGRVCGVAAEGCCTNGDAVTIFTEGTAYVRAMNIVQNILVYSIPALSPSG